jgi:hypothetical protein
MIIEQKTAPRLQQRYANEFIDMIKVINDTLNDINNDYRWGDITSITDSHRYQLTNHLDYIVLNANALLKDLDTKNRQIL